MFKSRFFKNSAKIVSLLAGAAMLITAFAPSALALNYNGEGGGTGNKSFNFNGYEYVDSTHVKLYFDKQSVSGDDTATPIVEGIHKDHFAISLKNSPYTAVSISSITVSSGSNKSGVSGTYLNKGTTVTLNLGSSLSADTLYKLEMDTDTLMNNNNMSLGNYRTGMAFDFTFKTPDGSGDYTGTPDVSFWQANSATGVPWESNIVFVVDRPLKEDTISSLLSTLSTNFKKSGNTVTQDDTIDEIAVQGAESYTPVANIPRTAFIFPLVASNSAEVTTTCYNLSSGSYSLEVPVITDVDNNSTSASETTSFTTVSNDIAGWLEDAPTYSNLTYNSVRINWSDGVIEPVADTFDLYKSENMYDNYAKVNVSDITGTSPYYYDVSNLTPETTYYFRVVPKNSYGAAGFSPAVKVVTPEEE